MKRGTVKLSLFGVFVILAILFPAPAAYAIVLAGGAISILVLIYAIFRPRK